MATTALTTELQTRNPLWSTLDTFQSDLSESGAHTAISRLTASLAEYRARMAPDAWKVLCSGLDSHPAVSQLLEDPCLRDARQKPAGYAGDARMLDYVYFQDPGPQPMTPTGRALFKVSTRLPIAAAVRERCASLADAIVGRARAGDISIASIACGHARELDLIPYHLMKRIRFWGLDHDPRSVEHCRSQHGSPHATFHVGSVRDLLAGHIAIPSSDFVYASGLFDYLDEHTGALLLGRMIAALNDGGSVVVPNLTPENDEVGYIEAVLDWWMSYRTVTDMARLASLAAGDRSRLRTTTRLGPDNRIVWLQIDRVD
jgi:extracellular factor (EF) 3-hydroxypalmitic acid methyl ester biosynthesis protein